RHLALERAAALRQMLPNAVQSVAVLVDPDDALIDHVIRTGKPDFLQLHGRETPERLHQIKQARTNVKLIKAIKVSASDDIAQSMRFAQDADMFLFDAKPPEDAMLPG